MNFLAHIYLSADDKQLQIGNFIGDYVKGNKYLEYPEKIKDGILLHRDIDYYTDNHALVKEAKVYFRKLYGLYSGILVDMFFDHFLAKDWDNYHRSSLNKFCSDFYFNLVKHYKHLPKRVQYFSPFLIQNNRLMSYNSVDGIQSALKLMVNYTSLPDKTDEAISILKDNYASLNNLFDVFIKDLISHVQAHEIMIRNKANLKSA